MNRDRYGRFAPKSATKTKAVKKTSTAKTTKKTPVTYTNRMLAEPWMHLRRVKYDSGLHGVMFYDSGMFYIINNNPHYNGATPDAKTGWKKYGKYSYYISTGTSVNVELPKDYDYRRDLPHLYDLGGFIFRTPLLSKTGVKFGCQFYNEDAVRQIISIMYSLLGIPQRVVSYNIGLPARVPKDQKIIVEFAGYRVDARLLLSACHDVMYHIATHKKD